MGLWNERGVPMVAVIALKFGLHDFGTDQGDHPVGIGLDVLYLVHAILLQLGSFSFELNEPILHLSQQEEDLGPLVSHPNRSPEAIHLQFCLILGWRHLPDFFPQFNDFLQVEFVLFLLFLFLLKLLFH